MGGDGARKSRYELLWESMSVASRGALDAVDKDVCRFFSGVFFSVEAEVVGVM